MQTITILVCSVLNKHCLNNLITKGQYLDKNLTKIYLILICFKMHIQRKISVTLSTICNGFLSKNCNTPILDLWSLGTSLRNQLTFSFTLKKTKIKRLILSIPYFKHFCYFIIHWCSLPISPLFGRE